LQAVKTRAMASIGMIYFFMAVYYLCGLIIWMARRRKP